MVKAFTKVGTLKNHVGSSGSMEPKGGAECVVGLGLNSDVPVTVSELCLDLDAKTPAAVRAACNEYLLPVPKQCHDPNHYVKTAKGRFLEVKKAVKIMNCFLPHTQVRLAKEFSQALHQWRKSGDKDKLKGAIQNVSMTTAIAAIFLSALLRKKSAASPISTQTANGSTKLRVLKLEKNSRLCSPPFSISSPLTHS